MSQVSCDPLSATRVSQWPIFGSNIDVDAYCSYTPSVTRADVLLVEDDPSTVSLLKHLLESWGYGGPVAVASEMAAVAAAQHHHIDLAVVDIGLESGPGGIAVAHELRTRFDIPTVFVTGHSDEVTLDQAKLAKPVGYVVKPFVSDQLRATIELALHQVQAERLARAQAPGRPTRPAATTPSPLPSPAEAGRPPSLTKREKEILRRLAGGATTMEIAGGLRISLSTTRNHIKSVLGKLRVHSRLEAVAVALRSGLVHLNNTVRPEASPTPESDRAGN
jgi:DNA-binding NarL/FixJ family response regulator